ncbi:MAG: TatD family hydrolase [Minisyncoccia bacterium]
MSVKYFDAHCHIQFDQYESDREKVLLEMERAEVGGIIVGVDAPSSLPAHALVTQHPQAALFAAAGHHPNHVPLESFDEKTIRTLLADEKVVAVGECGLDYFRPVEVTGEVKRAQKELFEKHIALAIEYKKPLMIHGRPSKGTMDAYEDLIDLLRNAKRTHGDTLSAHIHFFVGNVDIAKSLFELNCTVSYTAVVTFAREYDEVIRYAPLDRLLTETDAPYVAPASRRGQRNDPLSVIDVVRTIASIRAEDEEKVRETVLQNAKRVFMLGSI